MSSPSMDKIVELQAWKLKELLKWREYLGVLVEAVKEVFNDRVEVYVFGSAVNGKLTVGSDIDIAIVLGEVPKSGLERARLIDKVWRIMENKGVPWWYPFEIHLLRREDLPLFREAGFTRLL